MRMQASIILTSLPESNKGKALQLLVGHSCIHYNAASVVIFKKVCAQIPLKYRKGGYNETSISIVPVYVCMYVLLLHQKFANLFQYY